MAELAHDMRMPPAGGSAGGTGTDLSAALADARLREPAALRVCRGCPYCREVRFGSLVVNVCCSGRNSDGSDSTRTIARVLNEFRCPKGKTMRDVQD